MYHITFFLDFRPFVEEKLTRFLAQDFSRASLYKEGRDEALRSIQDLPRPSEFYSYFWFVHGDALSQDGPVTHPDFRLYQDTSFSQINVLFEWFACRYAWALFPWGGVNSYMGLAFLTAEAEIRDRFIECSENSAVVHKKHQDRENMLISSYDVASRIEDVCQVVVLSEDPDETGHAVWEACNGSQPHPYVVFNEYDENYQPDWWPEAKFTVVRSLGALDGDRLALYQPHDKRTFMRMCGYAGRLMGPVIALPGTAAVDGIMNFLEKIDSEFAYSDLSYLQDGLDLADWLYALERGHMDARYSLFVARESRLIRTLTSLAGPHQKKPFGLISCF